MASARESNVERLRNAGLITGTELPPEYSEVFEGLSDDQVDLLITVKERLDTAQEKVDEPYATWVVPL